MHAKYIVSDNQYVFIGSANIDPRSENLNTEIGLVIQSEPLSKQIIHFFNNAVSLENSYQLKLNREGDIRWISQENGVNQQFNQEPKAGIWKRVIVLLIGLLPVEHLL